MFKSTLGIGACVAATGIAYAAVIIDDEGIGLVGKGDVQLVLGWNNAQLQAAAEDVQFRMNSSSTPLLPLPEPLFSSSCAPNRKSNFLAVETISHLR